MPEIWKTSNISFKIHKTSLNSKEKCTWNCMTVPAGHTITYGELAKRIGCKSAQAVGQALHNNPFAPDVPCHRVIAANGKIGGYALGIKKKLEILKSEGCKDFGQN